VKPWQITLVSLLIQTLAEADMARDARASDVAAGVARANMLDSAEAPRLCVGAEQNEGLKGGIALTSNRREPQVKTHFHPIISHYLVEV
jgi:hypothetical protein